MLHLFFLSNGFKTCSPVLCCWACCAGKVQANGLLQQSWSKQITMRRKMRQIVLELEVERLEDFAGARSSALSFAPASRPFCRHVSFFQKVWGCGWQSRARCSCWRIAGSFQDDGFMVLQSSFEVQQLALCENTNTSQQTVNQQLYTFLSLNRVSRKPEQCSFLKAMEPPSSLPLSVQHLVRYRQIYILLIQMQSMTDDLLDLARGAPISELPSETVLEQIQLLEAQIEATLAANYSLMEVLMPNTTSSPSNSTAGS